MELDQDYAIKIKSYTNAELIDVLKHIDKDKFRNRFNALILEMGNRKLLPSDFTMDDFEMIQFSVAASSKTALNRLVLIFILFMISIFGLVILFDSMF